MAEKNDANAKGDDSSPSSKPVYLDPSPLGTKEYWSTLYSTDLQTRASNIPSHTGTTWFDDAGAEEKTVAYLSSLLKPTTPASPSLSLQDTSFLDLGTGNGSLLIALRKAGWNGPMTGVDYAESSVELAGRIWAGITESGFDANSSSSSESEADETTDPRPSPSFAPISFRTLDILSLSDPDVDLPDWIPEVGFDVVLDKGTFDAVSLSGDVDARTGRRVVEVYAAAARRMLRFPSGRMVVTSCNWTESELERWFCEMGQGRRLKVVDKVPYRRFRFGGQEGSVVVGLVFGWDRDHDDDAVVAEK